MLNASLSLLLLLGLPPGQCQAPAREATTSQNDLAAMRIILEEIAVDPNNQRAQSLLKDLWQSNLRKREAALEPGLKAGGAPKASPESQKRLSQAIEVLDSVKKEGRPSGGASPADSGMFTALVRGAADSYEQGRQKDAMLLLSTALDLYPAKTSTQVLSEVATSTQPATPDAAESARQLFRAGIRFYRAGDLAQAAQSFREGLAYDPSNEWIKESLERTMDELKKSFDKSMKDLKLNAAVAPSRPASQPASQPAPQPAPQSPEPSAARHVVQKGDTFWNLAQRYYGDPQRWEVIRDANGQNLELGATVLIPPVAASSGAVKRQQPAVATDRPRSHVVRKGDSLTRLAKKYYGNASYFQFILRANPGLKDGDDLKFGSTLVIPPLPKTSPRQ
ncbi:MAG: LysM peptidoglycan-binding domain-containing protein [Elusimicrobia bacterium]|nr:LysM peptidoglycan-binding domain-containing protein [Elusimicrobiota bacterium]